jgi:pyruvate dehydrogenase E2 component (dihydrolipoamide acetyltransferase)
VSNGDELDGGRQVRVPDIGDFTDVDVIEVLVKAGDRVDPEQPLITLETDKAAMDVPSPRAGVVGEVHVVAGGKVSEGDLVVTFAASADAPGAAAASPPHAAAPPASEDSLPPAATAAPATDEPVTVEGIEVRVPDMGDFADVEVIDVLVAPGQEVVAEAPLITLETDKAAMDVPAPQDGRVTAVHVATGDRVSEGALIIHLQPAGAAAAAQPVSDAAAVAAAPPAGAHGGPATAAPPAATGEAAGTGDVAAPADAATGAAAGEVITVEVPDIGDFTDVSVVDVLVAVGDAVEPEAPLITLETDKAAMDVPSPSAGIVEQVLVTLESTVSRGDAVVRLRLGAAAAAGISPGAATPESGDASIPAAAAMRAPPITASPPVHTPTPAGSEPVAAANALPPVDEAGFARAHAGPSVRRFARELGVDLSRLKGSGLKGRIIEDDVKSFVKSVMKGAASPSAAPGPSLPQVPTVDFAKFGTVERRPLSRIQKISGPRLHASWVNVPHVTQFDVADITDMEATRKRLKPVAAEQDAKLTPLAFLVRACALVLSEFEIFRSSLDESSQSLVVKGYIHIGFAADTPNGLVVPVIRDADQKDLFAIARDLADLAGKAREGKLKADQMQGGVFTISSLGGIGGTAFTPIINAPEVAILGVSRSTLTPVHDGEQFVPRLMLPLSLSYDHRVIDGAAAVRFTTRLGEVLAEVDSLLPDGLQA